MCDHPVDTHGGERREHIVNTEGSREAGREGGRDGSREGGRDGGGRK